jgi:hypothetical protein
MRRIVFPSTNLTLFSPPYPLGFLVQDIVVQLQRFVSAVAFYHDSAYSVLKDANVFPIEVDLTRGALGSTLK